MHVVEEVAAHQRVTTTPVDIESSAAGDDDVQVRRVLVVWPLEESFPAPVFVEFVKDHRSLASAERLQFEVFGNRHHAESDAPTIALIVPVDVGGVTRNPASGRRLANLTRPLHEHHLALGGEVVPQHGNVDALERADHFTQHRKTVPPTRATHENHPAVGRRRQCPAPCFHAINRTADAAQPTTPPSIGVGRCAARSGHRTQGELNHSAARRRSVLLSSAGLSPKNHREERSRPVRLPPTASPNPSSRLAPRQLR